MDPYRPNPSPHGYYGAAEGAHAAPAPSEQPTARHVCLSKSLACSRINGCAICDAYVENYAFAFAITAARLTVEQATLFYNAYKEAMIQLHVHMTRDPQISAGALDLRRVQILPEQLAYPLQPAAHAPPPYQPMPSPLASQPQAAWQPPWPPPAAPAPPPAMTAPPPPPPPQPSFQQPSAGQLPQYGEHVASPFGSAPVGPPAASTARTYGGRAAPAAAGTPAAPQRAVPVVNLRPEIAAMVAARGMQNPLPPYADDGDDEGDEEDDYDDDAAADDGPSYETPEPPESDIPPFDYQPVDDESPAEAPPAMPVAAAPAVAMEAAPPASPPLAPTAAATRSQRSGNVALAPLPKCEELTVADVAGAGTPLAVTTSGPRDVADEPPLNGTTRSPTG